MGEAVLVPNPVPYNPLVCGTRAAAGRRVCEVGRERSQSVWNSDGFPHDVNVCFLTETACVVAMVHTSHRPGRFSCEVTPDRSNGNHGRRPNTDPHEPAHGWVARNGRLLIPATDMEGQLCPVLGCPTRLLRFPLGQQHAADHFGDDHPSSLRHLSQVTTRPHALCLRG